MEIQKFQIGDIVKVTRHTPGHYAPGVKAELGTEALFPRVVGKRYRIINFDGYGYLERHKARHDVIWINATDVKLAAGKGRQLR